MTKFRVGDIARIKVRKIKKFDPGESLQKAWEQRYAKPKQITATEEEFITSAAQMKPKIIRYGEILSSIILHEYLSNIFNTRLISASNFIISNNSITPLVKIIIINYFSTFDRSRYNCPIF